MLTSELPQQRPPLQAHLWGLAEQGLSSRATQVNKAEPRFTRVPAELNNQRQTASSQSDSAAALRAPRGLRSGRTPLVRLLRAVQAGKLSFKGRHARLQLLAAWHGLGNQVHVSTRAGSAVDGCLVSTGTVMRAPIEDHVKHDFRRLSTAKKTE